MKSAFGIEHGEVSKGLPSAVKAGGGGSYGGLLRSKANMGKLGAKHSSTRDLATMSGRAFKERVETRMRHARVSQVISGRAARRQHAELLSRDSSARRAGFKTGKTSGLASGYRGRIANKMTELP